PDLAWVIQERWEALPPEQRTKFPPICPDFVVELMSPSDTLKATQDKMKEYIENGARLGWLIAPEQRRVEIYRPQQAVQVLEAPATLSGDDVLPGFIIDLSSLW
ncbi:MAG: Uma2 family endonuclease, partial [Coleofasciculus sp. C2-GNP5-27]